MSKIGIRASDLLELVIKPTLIKLGKDSAAARQLLLCTAAQESSLGHYLKQINGPALGIYQIEPATHVDVYKNVLAYDDELFLTVDSFSFNKAFMDRQSELVTNLAYSTVIARLIYSRFKEPLPEYGDINAMAAYWKNYFNTSSGKGTIDEFTDNYHRYIAGNI